MLSGDKHGLALHNISACSGFPLGVYLGPDLEKNKTKHMNHNLKSFK